MLRKITILFFIILASCSSDKLKLNEKTILINLYMQEFQKLEAGVDYYTKLGTKTTDISKLISETSKELKENGNIKSSKGNIAKYLSSRLNTESGVDQILVDSLRSNLTKFVNSELTFLEELNFTKLVFEYGYWTIWSCTSFNIIENNYYQIDTLEFRPNSENIVKFSNPKLNDFKLLSNSLQTRKPNELTIKTKTERLKTVNYSYTGQSLVTGETKTFEDSIIVKIVKTRDNK